MKKIGCVLATLFLIFSFCAVTASAAVDPNLKVSVVADKTTINPGDVVTVTVSIPENSSLGCLTFNLNYDPAAFAYVADSEQHPSGFFGMTMVNTNVSGQVKYVGTSSTFITKGGVILTAQFEVLRSNNPVIHVVYEEIVDGSVADGVLITEAVAAQSTGAIAFSCAHKSMVRHVATEATCTQAGQANLQCAECAHVSGTEVIAPLGHDIPEGVITQEATCTHTGAITGTCTRCGLQEQQAILPAIAHRFGAWNVRKAATETEAGVRERTCLDCGFMQEESIEPLDPDLPILAAEEEKEETVVPVTTNNKNPNIPKTSGIFASSLAAVAVLAVTTGAVTLVLKVKKED